MKAHKRKCTMDEYNAIQAARNTELKVLIQQSPAHYLHSIRNPKEPSRAKILGSAIHEAVLEPKLFKEKMVVVPVFEGRTKKGELTTNMNCEEVREKSEIWHLENHGKTKVSKEELDSVQAILNAISKHTSAAQLMSEGHAEESLFWTDLETGIDCKARPDFIRQGHILVDIKSTEDCSPKSFYYDARNYGYHFQAAMYLDAASAVFDTVFDTFIIIAVEKTPPYEVACFELEDPFIQEGRELFYSALAKLKPCLKSGIYPGYGNELLPLGPGMIL